MSGGGAQPGDRVRQIQDEQAPAPWKYGEYPQDTQTADTDYGDKHGNNGIVKPPQAAYQHVHHTA